MCLVHWGALQAPHSVSTQVSAGRLLYLCAPGSGGAGTRPGEASLSSDLHSVPRSAQGAEVGQGAERALLSSLSSQSLVLAPPQGQGPRHNLHSLTTHLMIFTEKFLGVGFSISSQCCLWKQWERNSLPVFLPRWSGNLTFPSTPSQPRLT